MTTTHSTNPFLLEEGVGADPDYLAQLLRNRGLLLDYWNADFGDGETTAYLNVVFRTREGHFRHSSISMLPDNLWILLDPRAEALEGPYEKRLVLDLADASEPLRHLEDPAEDEGWQPYESRPLSDKEILISAAIEADGLLGRLLAGVADLIDDIPLGTSLLDPRVRLVYQALQVAEGL